MSKSKIKPTALILILIIQEDEPLSAYLEVLISLLFSTHFINFIGIGSLILLIFHLQGNFNIVCLKFQSFKGILAYIYLMIIENIPI